MKENDDELTIPNQLLTSIINRDCVFYIGAGLSIDAGLPSGKELAKILNEIYAKNGHSEEIQPLYKIAQKFEDFRGRPNLITVIKESIVKNMEHVDKIPHEMLRRIKPQPVNIITTNWDKLIEDAYGARNIVTILNDDSLTQHTTVKTNLIKIHGDIEDLMHAIITEHDYATFKRNHSGFDEKIRTLFREKTLLFIGYSTEDWDFLIDYLQIQEELHNNTNPRYCVLHHVSDETNARLSKLNIRSIQMNVRDFLQKVSESLDGKDWKPGKLYEEHPKFPDPRLEIVVQKNPFIAFRAEDMTEDLWRRELFREPVMYNIFTDIISHGNTIIEGHRGSGKSMILLYLSYPIQRLLGKNPDFVGIYIKLDLPLFATTRKRGESYQDWLNFFLGYFNLIVAESIVKFLYECINKSWIKMDNIDQFLIKLKQLFPFIDCGINNLLDFADSLCENRNMFAGAPPRKIISVPPDTIRVLIDRLRRFIPGWQELPVYLLLDEYERLDENQQRVVNLLLASRGPTFQEKIYFKIATKSFMSVLEDSEGNQLEPIDDYTPVFLDRFDLDEERKHKYYQKLIEDIANWRLQNIWDYGISIKTLLPEEEAGSRKGFKNRDYSGFENIVSLSSFLPRDFLELCKDMIFYAYPKLLLSPKSSTLEPISPNIQNTVIQIHGDNLLENLNRITDDENRPLLRTRSENARRLVESWGEIFKRILIGSNMEEARTVSEFQIRSLSNLTKESRNALNDSTLRRALVIPLTKRVPQIRKNVPADRYEFHRLLCARSGLSLARRWPKEIDAEWINDLINSENPKKLIDDVTKHFIIKDEFPLVQKKLYDYGMGGKILSK